MEETPKSSGEFLVLADGNLADALIETLLLGHPGRSGLFVSFLSIC